MGKQIFLHAWVGKKDESGIQWTPEADALLANLSNLGRLMRWIACCYFSSEDLELLKSDPRVKWVEGSACAHMWQCVESYCMHHWKDYVLQKPVAHASLCYDGIRLNRARVNAEESFMQASSAYMAAQRFGFQVHIREKTHCSFYDKISSCEHQAITVDTEDLLLCKPGNGIPAALWHILGGNKIAQCHILSTLRQAASGSSGRGGQSQTFCEACTAYQLN